MFSEKPVRLLFHGQPRLEVRSVLAAGTKLPLSKGKLSPRAMDENGLAIRSMLKDRRRNPRVIFLRRGVLAVEVSPGEMKGVLIPVNAASVVLAVLSRFARPDVVVIIAALVHPVGQRQWLPGMSFIDEELARLDGPFIPKRNAQHFPYFGNKLHPRRIRKEHRAMLGKARITEKKLRIAARIAVGVKIENLFEAAVKDGISLEL